MICRMQLSDQTPLSIARHAIQFIWQTSLAVHNNKTIGLLGSQIKGEIDTATHTSWWQVSPSPSAQDVTSITQENINQLSQTWQNNHIFLSGVYQFSQPTVYSMQATEDLLKPYFNHHDDIPFIHLNISFDTKGVLESEAWIIQNEQAIQIPMLLTEDRQPAAKS